MLISETLGEYQLDRAAGSTPGLPSGVWLPSDMESGDEVAPAIAVAHPMPPLLSTMEEWRAGLDWITAQCRIFGPNVIVARDLNATVDHLWGIEGCNDAALDTRTAARGTWPGAQPTWPASPIDHVLAGDSWKTSEFRVIESDDGGSDHRPIVAVLTRR